MSTELALFLLAVMWAALAFGLGYVVGVRAALRPTAHMATREAANRTRTPKPYDWQGGDR